MKGLKQKLKLLKVIFEEAGIDKKIFEKIEDRCIAMSHLGFPENYIEDNMYRDIKAYLKDAERSRFNFVNIAEKYDFDVEFLNS